MRMRLAFFVLVCVVAALVVVERTCYRHVQDIKVDWWRVYGPHDDNSAAEPFRIQYADTNLPELFRRLDDFLARSEHDVEVVDSSTLGNEDRRRGLPLRDLKRLAETWRYRYNWKERAERLNALGPQYTLAVNGLRVHYFDIRAKKSDVDATPILLLHGWPGSFTEFTNVVSPLSGNGNVDLVVASLPGFGFSDAPPSNVDFDFVDAAVLFAKLMRRVHPGKQYVCQGGDYGSFVCSALGQVDSKNVLGVHLNMATVAFPPWIVGGLASWGLIHLFPFTLSESNRNRLSPSVPAFLLRMLQETGYFHVQATKPETIAHGLEDSPVFLLAWIAERFYAWGDLGVEGDGFKPVSDEAILDNVQVYLQSRTARSAARWYYYLVRGWDKSLASLLAPVPVPTSIIDAPFEIFRPPTFWLKDHRYPKLVRYTEAKRGGHFFAMEMPEFLAEDLLAFVYQLRPSETKL